MAFIKDRFFEYYSGKYAAKYTWKFALSFTCSTVFYILKGTATFEINNELIQVTESNGIHIKPNEKHRISNNTNSELEFLVISEPKSHGDRTNL